jgi:tetratricopeptide (TPR) repeat protein
MRWIASLLSLLFLLALAGGVRAAGADDQYLDIYNQILQADALLLGGHQDAAAVKYRDALTALQKMHDEHPAWNPTVMSFRLADLAEKVKSLAQYLPGANSTPAAATAANPNARPQDPLAALQEQIQALTAANNELQMKLKEALSVQPAAVAPGELARAEEKNLQLQRTNDLLTVTVQQLKAAKSAPPTESPKTAAELAALKTRSAGESKQAQKEISDLKNRVDEAQKKLAETTADLNKLKANPPVSENVKQLTAERDRLKKELATISKELADREAHPVPAPAPAAANDESLNLKLMAVVQQRDDLLKQVAALSQPATPPAQPAAAGSTAETERLRARLAVLEAPGVPYTAEEMAVLNSGSKTLVAAPAVAGAAPKRPAHSIKDLPPGAGALMADAQRDAMERNYADAEKKYQQVLVQDPDNVFVLVNLGNAEFDLGHLEDCEKNAQRALTLDPEEPYALYLLGILRYKEQRLDESLDALSRSAGVNATNANTQYSLGRVLTDKGLPAKAETAFRKALELEPGHADAHYYLAVVYALEKPPSLALARWHYQKSIDLGHPRKPEMDKLLAGEK